MGTDLVGRTEGRGGVKTGGAFLLTPSPNHRPTPFTNRPPTRYYHHLTSPSSGQPLSSANRQALRLGTKNWEHSRQKWPQLEGRSQMCGSLRMTNHLFSFPSLSMFKLLTLQTHMNHGAQEAHAGALLV